MILPKNFIFSQGSLQNYVDCPYSFYLRYVLKTSWPALVVDQALDFEQRLKAGERFHRLVQQYLLGIPSERISLLADEDAYPDLQDWWNGFVRYVPTWLNGERWVEMTLISSLAEKPVMAKYDLILVENQPKLTIFDWKTSKKPANKVRLLERIQTRLYRLILYQASSALIKGQTFLPEQITMHYWYATHPQKPISLVYSQAEYEKDRDYLILLIDTISNAEEQDFFRTDDLSKCQFCVYRSHCDRGVKAGNLEDFEQPDYALDEIQGLIEFDDLPEIEF
jgi:hypothetical protein